MTLGNCENCNHLGELNEGLCDTCSGIDEFLKDDELTAALGVIHRRLRKIERDRWLNELQKRKEDLT